MALFYTVYFLSGPSTQEFVQVSAAGISGGFTFPAGQSSTRIMFNINNDEVGLEDLETYIAVLSIDSATTASGVGIGAIATADVQIVDDDGTKLCVFVECVYCLYLHMHVCMNMHACVHAHACVHVHACVCR